MPRPCHAEYSSSGERRTVTVRSTRNPRPFRSAGTEVARRPKGREACGVLVANQAPTPASATADTPRRTFWRERVDGRDLIAVSFQVRPTVQQASSHSLSLVVIDGCRRRGVGRPRAGERLTGSRLRAGNLRVGDRTRHAARRAPITRRESPSGSFHPKQTHDCALHAAEDGSTSPIPRENPSSRSATVGRTHPALLRRPLLPAASPGAPVSGGAHRCGPARGRWLLDHRSVQDLPPPRGAAWRGRGRRRGALPAGPTGSPKDPARSA